MAHNGAISGTGRSNVHVHKRPSDLGNSLNNMSAREIMNQLNNPNVPDEQKIDLLNALINKNSRTVDPTNNTVGDHDDDESQVEKLHKKAEHCKDKITHHEKLSAEDAKELHGAIHEVKEDGRAGVGNSRSSEV